LKKYKSISLAPITLSRGHALRLKGRFSEALQAYDSALALSNDLTGQADAAVGIAMSMRGLCRYAESESIFDSALATYAALDDREGEAFALYGRGGARRFLGRFPEAAADLRRSLKLTKDPEARLFTTMAIGGLCRMTGRFRDSLKHYTAARTLAGRLRNRYAMAYADCGIGNAHRCLGDRAAALRHLRAADRRYRSIGDRVSRPYTLFALAMMELEAGHSPNAIAEAENLFRATGDKRGLVYIDFVAAAAAIATGRSPLAAARKALKGAAALGLKLEAAHARMLVEYPKTAAAGRTYRQLEAAMPLSIFRIP
jgi:tetratricopeptide (TPR) repeat protein